MADSTDEKLVDRVAEWAEQTLGMIADEQLTFVVVVAGYLVRRREHLVERRVEPPVDVRANQLAPDEQDEDGGHERHPEQQRYELSERVRKGKAAGSEKIAKPREPHRFAAGDSEGVATPGNEADGNKRRCRSVRKHYRQRLANHGRRLGR